VVNLSIVLTVYARYQYLSYAIDSLRRSGIPLDKYEVIVVADRPENIPFDRIKVIECKSQYHGECVITGVNESTSDVIVFLEDDDAFFEGKLRRVKEVFSSTQEVNYFHNRQLYIDTQSRKIRSTDPRVFIYEYFQPGETRLLRAPRDYLETWLKYPALHHNLSSIAIRKRLIKGNEEALTKLRSSIDWALTLLSMTSTGVHDKGRLTYYRIGSGSTSIGKSRDELKRLLEVYERELQSKLTFLKYAELEDVQLEYGNLDVRIHRLYLDFLKGNKPSYSFGSKDALDLSKRRQLVHGLFEFVLLNSSRHETLFRTLGKLTGTLMGAFLR
jgi:glycosyltransferase involved in cell wall biosynthesis